ncbi:response regulator [Rhizobium sp. BK602]|uniref:response regulator n=1 Tax=Rhizobium sp. BK602 TaxID=2586986 RepID=UPI001610A88D|nr:response regulator [Rhizobium sp. BK602]MBB3609771.1 CheY-like chemotaxis protein [Rhizobium sp. BK602]
MSQQIDIAAEASILVIDDEAANIALMERLLRREGFRKVTTTTDPRDAVRLFNEVAPDIVLLDLMMPHLDGFALLDAFSRLTGPASFVPIVVLTADVTVETRRRALSLGAKDFLVKPIDAVETILRIFNLLETRFLFRALTELTGQSPFVRRGDPAGH